jgi:hypothetical protein
MRQKFIQFTPYILGLVMFYGCVSSQKDAVERAAKKPCRGKISNKKKSSDGNFNGKTSNGETSNNRVNNNGKINDKITGNGTNHGKI